MPTPWELTCAALAAAASVLLLIVQAKRHDRERAARFGRLIRRPAPSECERGQCFFPNCPADCPELADAANACAWREGESIGIIGQSTEGKTAAMNRVRARFEEEGVEVWISSKTGLPVPRPRSRIVRVFCRVSAFVLRSKGVRL